jgi:8-oxo-dGTP pyrophosphatase MutT (NUDIX family)
MNPTKACPIVLRETSALEVLAFEHPLAGLQLVKGSIEPGETPQEAAERELKEEAGVEGRALLDLGTWDSNHEGQVWSLQLCGVASSLPDRWSHRTADDGGHEFGFFWHPLHEEPGAQWHPVYRRALSHLRGMSLNMSIDTDPQQQAGASPRMLVVRSSSR